ncbi:26216_t:CDS:2 [Gigaspora margarita]|uniref:26216_t:CDS:1 n=1 Tax=Gigaspora margarita TaxID=4874 RepID=A0ABN7V8A8_GIGMA|nr:26216_t:CDS:2 [Gigaspora margarita]
MVNYDIPIIDNVYDLEDEEAAETVFEKLITNARNLDKDSHWRYTGNSVRTKQQKLQENRINTIGSPWAKKCLEGDPLPPSQCEKHPSKSLLYDDTHEFWGPDKEQLLRKKGLGKGLHVSEFLTETIRQLRDEEGEARVIVETGKSQDENWDGKKLLSQLKNAIEIFEQMHSGCIRIWAFDNATSHTVMAPNALVAARINLYPSENCDYTWKELKNNVSIALDSISVEIIRQHARLSY